MKEFDPAGTSGQLTEPMKEGSPTRTHQLASRCAERWREEVKPL